VSLWPRWGKSREKVARDARRAETRRGIEEAARALRAGDGGGGVPQPVVDEPDPDERRTIVSPPTVVVQVESTVRRTPGVSREKSGDIVSPSFLGWARSQPCAACAKGPSDPHHFPSKGALGMTVDLLVIPYCRTCHDKAQAYGIGKVQQCLALIQTLVHFFTRAPRSLKREVFTEIAKGLA